MQAQAPEHTWRRSFADTLNGGVGTVTMERSSRYVSNGLGLLGAGVGGALGYALFEWLSGRGFLAPFLPGVLVGLGSSALARHPSTSRGTACGLVAILIGLFVVWRNIRFSGLTHGSFLDFLTHLHAIPPLYPILVGLGGLIAFWLGRDHFGWGPARRPATDKPAS